MQKNAIPVRRVPRACSFPQRRTPPSPRRSPAAANSFRMRCFWRSLLSGDRFLSAVRVSACYRKSLWALRRASFLLLQKLVFQLFFLTAKVLPTLRRALLVASHEQRHPSSAWLRRRGTPRGSWNRRDFSRGFHRRGQSLALEATLGCLRQPMIGQAIEVP